MSWRIGIVLFLNMVLFLGCSFKEPRVNIPMLRVDVNDSKNFLIFEALYNQYNDKNLSKSVENYTKLYNQTKSKVYLISAIKLSFVLQDDKNISKLLNEGLKKFPKDKDILKIYAKKEIEDKNYDKAQKLIKKFLLYEKNPENYNLYGDTFYLQGKYKQALKYFKKAYSISFDELALIKISTLLDENLHKRKKAIEYLQTHTKFDHDVSLPIYLKLLQLYGKDSDIDGLISTYKSMFNKFKDQRYEKKVVELYMYKNDTKKAIEFLKNSSHNEDLLMKLYSQNNNFKMAYSIAEILYKQSGNIEYLGRMAIYEYELNQNKLTPNILKSVSKKFDEVVERMQLPLFLNYYGYLLIDHDLNIEKGITYVKMALEQEPTSVYYIDSLAWGYYKLKRCKEALKLLDSIIDKSDEEDIKKHYEAIKECLKGQN